MVGSNLAIMLPNRFLLGCRRRFGSLSRPNVARDYIDPRSERILTARAKKKGPLIVNEAMRETRSRRKKSMDETERENVIHVVLWGLVKKE